MKKVFALLSLTLALTANVKADYLMVTTDSAGVSTEQCVKSYSFSNVTESAVAQENVQFDVYSDEETLTNKVWMGKPVYRKVITFPRGIGDRTINHNIDDYDHLWVTYFSSVHDGGTIEATSYYAGNSRDNFIRVRPGTITFYGRTDAWTTVSTVVEYTKLNDEDVTISSGVKTYVNYLPSETEVPSVLDIENTAIRFAKDYAYDSVAGTCLPK